MVRLVPMTREEIAGCLEASVVEFGQQLQAEGVSADEAEIKVRQRLSDVLRQGIDTPGHRFNWIESDGARVGRVWTGPAIDEPNSTHLWEIVIDPDQRGSGLGGEVLDLIEEQERERSTERITLNVFHSNNGARRLYERKGYVAGEPEGDQIPMTLDLT